MDPQPLNADDLFYAQVGSRVKLARKKLGLTQDAVAAAVNLTRTSITNIEKGRQKLLLHTFCALARALKQNPAHLLPEVPEGPGATPPAPAGLGPAESAFFAKAVKAASQGRK